MLTVTRSTVLIIFITMLLTGCVTAPQSVDNAVFEYFKYQGKDAVFDQPLADDHFQNPILAGFYPDPSITRAGDDFYMVNSSFSFYPGMPIFHSTDLINWRPLGHVLTRPEQIDLDGLGVSRGIYAPTIRYHEGTFYVVGTEVDGRGNFLVTAQNPEGPWSDPIWLPEVQGIDPDIFFDDDGRIYIAHNGGPEGESLYQGHRAIWLWEYNPEEKAVFKDSGRVIVNGGSDISQKPIWIEAPHIFKKDGWYYLSCAEGGTGYDHSQVVFRTRDLNEPFVPYGQNPILTQRDLDKARPNPITSAGHADLVQTSAGEWWAVFLATRAYDQTLYNTGRETFLLPVTWKDGWPEILAKGEPIPYQLKKPAGLPITPDAEPMTGNFTWLEEFDNPQRSVHWQLLRTGSQAWYDIDAERSYASIKPLPVSLASKQRPAAMLYRQKHASFEAETLMRLPLPQQSSAGITAFQNETHHYYFGVENGAKGYVAFLEQANGGMPTRIESVDLPEGLGAITLGVEGAKGLISFFYTAGDGQKQYIAKNADARILSTEIAGGFVGAHIGLHARSSFIPINQLEAYCRKN